MQAPCLRSVNIEGNVRADVLALPPGHPYLRLPLQMSIGLEPRLRSFVDAKELHHLNQEPETRLRRRNSSAEVVHGSLRTAPAAGENHPEVPASEVTETSHDQRVPRYHGRSACARY